MFKAMAAGSSGAGRDDERIRRVRSGEEVTAETDEQTEEQGAADLGRTPTRMTSRTPTTTTPKTTTTNSTTTTTSMTTTSTTRTRTSTTTTNDDDDDDDDDDLDDDDLDVEDSESEADEDGDTEDEEPRRRPSTRRVGLRRPAPAARGGPAGRPARSTWTDLRPWRWSPVERPG